jgi:hypothetical protein
MRRSSTPALFVAVTISLIATSAHAQQSYKTPDEAAEALVSAACADDRGALLKVLGIGGRTIVSSGDAVADKATRAEFVSAYDAKHGISKENGKRAVLTIGANDWPFPIPLVAADGGWKFDTATGREEILARRIGRNELAAIQASRAYADAQNEYAGMQVKNGRMPVYARRIISRPGQRDGLYWPTAQGEPESPLGELIASATAGGYRTDKRARPYHGYYYRILTRQGPAAQGGVHDYVVRGQMIVGFALVAYPAEYGSSGVMTFLINHNGEVFQKDLGRNTRSIASRMVAYNPDRTWSKVAATAQKR